MVLFHQQQAAQWGALSETIDAYLESVRELAEQMAVNGEPCSAGLGAKAWGKASG